MHDIWNPWHGCVRVSPGCANCYMYFLDRQRGQDGRHIYRTSSFDYPLQRDQAGRYRVQSGELIRVCMTSDFFWRRRMNGVKKLGTSCTSGPMSSFSC